METVISQDYVLLSPPKEHIDNSGKVLELDDVVAVLDKKFNIICYGNVKGYQHDFQDPYNTEKQRTVVNVADEPDSRRVKINPTYLRKVKVLYTQTGATVDMDGEPYRKGDTVVILNTEYCEVGTGHVIGFDYSAPVIKLSEGLARIWDGNLTGCYFRIDVEQRAS